MMGKYDEHTDPAGELRVRCSGGPCGHVLHMHGPNAGACVCMFVCVLVPSCVRVGEGRVRGLALGKGCDSFTLSRRWLQAQCTPRCI